MVAVAQLVRASGCGPEGRRFESDQPPHLEIPEVRVSVSPIFFALKVNFQQKIVNPLCVPQSSRCFASDCPAHLLRFLVGAVALLRLASGFALACGPCWEKSDLSAVVLTEAKGALHTPSGVLHKNALPDEALFRCRSTI